MASPVQVSAREAALSEELTRFWESMGRKFERGPSHRTFTPLQRDSSHLSWESLVHPHATKSLTRQKEDGERWAVEEVYETRDVHDTTLEECEIRSCDVCFVDGSCVGDVPAQYRIQGLQPHERPVVGTYVDPAITVGFCYQVRQADSTKLLFKGQALRLLSVGMGYGKRITFISSSHNVNNNYFWSDSYPEGYGFRLCVVQEGEKFTLRDANDVPVATVEAMKIMGSQVEVGHHIFNDGGVEKQAKVSLLCKVSFFDETSMDQVLVVKGVAVAVKAKGSRTVATLKKIKECSLGGERGYTLVPGTDASTMIAVVNGEKIGDIPIKYSVKGLLPHEMPVVGTYVDPRILTGFRYRVRATDSKRPMFSGAALTLQAIGRGYGKRLTFASDNLNNNENYFWSDSNPEGYGFSIQAISPGDDFKIISSSGKDLGRARVFRADAPQVEESYNVSSEGHVTKRVRVTVTCDVTFLGEDHTLVVTGTAVVVRRGRVACVQRLEDVALGSQINILFRHTSETILFVRQ
ncbi:uncharacterized protein LOC121863739 [Homarus americanus]|uniref:uncharacterized protein LOC121863739 n=1 Tax=Homarus americanus TaxID=6706 RepID=UPI001C45786D|nr:uncharacterized protein LOC121863739 [Homarus americanus]